MLQLGIDVARMAFKPSSSVGLNRIVSTFMWKTVSGHWRFVYVTEVRQRVRAIVDETVRREKALDFSGCNSRPGTGSLHPVAIETAAEATKLSELSM